MSIEELRKYRIQFENPYFNTDSTGIALFDLSLTFVAAYILEQYFKLSDKLPGKNKIQTYYLLIIPFGIIIHHIMAHLQQKVLWPIELTFLNKKIFSLDLNIYKLLLIIMIYLIYNNIYV